MLDQKKKGEDLVENDNKQKIDVLLKQYDKAMSLIEHLDKTYIHTTLIYIAIIGAYIKNFEKITGNPTLISIGLLFLSSCIIGIIWRIRIMINQQRDLVVNIEKSTSMIEKIEIKGLGKTKTSTYFGISVIIITSLAIILTLNK